MQCPSGACSFTTGYFPALQPALSLPSKFQFGPLSRPSRHFGTSHAPQFRLGSWCAIEKLSGVGGHHDVFLAGSQDAEVLDRRHISVQSRSHIPLSFLVPPAPPVIHSDPGPSGRGAIHPEPGTSGRGLTGSWLVSRSGSRTQRERCNFDMSGGEERERERGGFEMLTTLTPPKVPPALLVFSGGTAFNGIVEELQNYTTRVAHVLPVSDDGGSTAEIVRVLGGPAVGDIRSRCLRLSDAVTPEVQAVKKLLRHRLALDATKAKQEWHDIVEGEHKLWEGISGPYKDTIRAFLVHFHSQILQHTKERFCFRNGSVGNFFFAGARTFFRSMDAAIFLYSRVSHIPPESLVLPAVCTNERLTLGAELEDGSVIRGQNEISHPLERGSPCSSFNNKTVDKASSSTPPLVSPIRRVFYMSSDHSYIPRALDNPLHEVFPPVNAAVLERLASVDAIIYGMGSLYTSICPSLILKGVGEAIAARGGGWGRADAANSPSHTHHSLRSEGFGSHHHSHESLASHHHGHESLASHHHGHESLASHHHSHDSLASQGSGGIFKQAALKVDERDWGRGKHAMDGHLWPSRGGAGPAGGGSEGEIPSGGKGTYCPKILLLNGSHDRETAGMSASDFVGAICDALNRRSGNHPAHQLWNAPSAYVTVVVAPRGGEIEVDVDRLMTMGIQRVVWVDAERHETGGVRYNSEALIRTFKDIMDAQRNVTVGHSSAKSSVQALA